MKNKLTTIYVVRHGESEGNLRMVYSENSELGSPLTETGKLQAKKAAEKFKEIDLAAIFSSDMTRAHQTAEVIALEKGLEVNTTNLIRERSFYQYLKKLPQKSEEELKAEIIYGLLKLDTKGKMKYKHTEAMESAAGGATRLLTFIREAASAYEGKTIMVVCHGDIMRSLLTHLGYAEYDELPHGSIDNTGYFILESDGVDFFIKETVGINKQEGITRDF